MADVINSHAFIHTNKQIIITPFLNNNKRLWKYESCNLLARGAKDISAGAKLA